MRIPVHLSSSKTYSNILQLLVLTAYIHPAFSIPHSLSARQFSIEALQLPNCALTCFLNGILSDGCANEADFACHCASGNIISESTACIEQGCDKDDESEAIRKVQSGCKALGGDSETGGSGDEGDSSGGSSRGAGSSTTNRGPSSSATTPTSTSQLLPSSPEEMTNTQTTPAPSSPNVIPSASPSWGSGSPTASPSLSSPSSSPLPTDMPLALLPPSHQLSAAAKAGISISVSIFALSIFFGLGWYIRRLKRELKAAQRAAAMIPDEVWRSTMATSTAAPDQESSVGRGRRISRYGRESPVSPLSPRDMEEIMTVTDIGYGVLKKKRGHVLSVVVEREEEDSSSSIDRIIREPVPGQREGLSGPLELDGEYTGIVELPIAITPRERSVERER